MLPMRLSPANRPLPPLPPPDEVEVQRQQVLRPRPALLPLSSSPPHDRSSILEKALPPPPPSQAAAVAATTAVTTRPRVPRMGTWSPHSLLLLLHQQPRASGEIMPPSNSKLEVLKAPEAGADGRLRWESHNVHGGNGKYTALAATAAAKCVPTRAGVTAGAAERRSWELHALPIAARKPADDLLAKSVPTDHAYAEYLTIPPPPARPRPPLNSQTSTMPAGSDDGYTSLNNPPSEEGEGGGECKLQQQKPVKEQPVGVMDPPQQQHRRRTSRRRRVRVLVKRVPRPSSSSCRWSSTSDGGATIYGGCYIPSQTLYQGPQQRHHHHHRRQHKRHQQQHKRRPDVARIGEGTADCSLETTTVSCIDDLYRLRIQRASSRQRDESKEQQWWQQQPQQHLHSTRTHRMKSRRNHHRSPSYTTAAKLPADHHTAASCLDRPKRETASPGTVALSMRHSTTTKSPTYLPPAVEAAPTAPSPVCRTEDSRLSPATAAHTHAPPVRRHHRSSSCRCHCSQRSTEVVSAEKAKTELELAGCGEADIVYEVVRSDTETTTEAEEAEDLQPLLAGEEGSSAVAVAYAKRFLYSSNYPGGGTLPAGCTARQVSSALSRPRRSANTIRRRPMHYDSCTMITMLVV